jgi:ribulose-5-phosphate 4-epimerase/fuculose-1-phosphate aldolase
MEAKARLLKKQEIDLIDPQEELYIRKKICSMCRNFYRLGWVSGTGGGISIRRKEIVYMAPSGVQKEKIRPEDIFVLDLRGNIKISTEFPIKTNRMCSSILFCL